MNAVLLAGDIVEQQETFHEAPDSQQGADRLTAARIRVLGVTGSHDVGL